MEDIIGAAAKVDGLGAVGVLFMGLCVSLWAVRFLYLRGEECDAARMADSEARSIMNREIGELSTRVETMSELHTRHLTALLEHHKKENN